VINASYSHLTLNLILQRFFLASGRFGMCPVFAFAWAIAFRLVWQAKKTRAFCCYFLGDAALIVGFAAQI
jgi:hypothetical protein